MALTPRDLRIAEAVPFAKRYAAKWVYAHGVIDSRADDVESDCMYVMCILAGEWDESRKVPWMKFLAGRIQHRLIDEIRLRAGDPRNRRIHARRKAVDQAGALPAHHDPSRTDPGYAEVEMRAELDRLLEPYSLRTRQMVRAYADGWTMAEIGVAHGVTESRVSMILRDVRKGGDLRVVRAVVAVKPLARPLA